MNAHGRRFVRGKALEDDLRSVIVDTILNEGGDGHFSNFIQNARTKIQSDLPPFIILSLKEQKLLERISSSVRKKCCTLSCVIRVLFFTSICTVKTCWIVDYITK